MLPDALYDQHKSFHTPSPLWCILAPSHDRVKRRGRPSLSSSEGGVTWNPLSHLTSLSPIPSVLGKPISCCSAQTKGNPTSTPSSWNSNGVRIRRDTSTT